jgi:hypothetical protein
MTCDSWIQDESVTNADMMTFFYVETLRKVEQYDSVLTASS